MLTRVCWSPLPTVPVPLLAYSHRFLLHWLCTALERTVVVAAVCDGDDVSAVVHHGSGHFRSGLSGGPQSAQHVAARRTRRLLRL